MLRSSPKCGKKGFRPEAVLESGLKDLEEVKGLEEDTNLIDRDLLEKQNGTSEDEENTKSSQPVEVLNHLPLHHTSFIQHNAPFHCCCLRAL